MNFLPSRLVSKNPQFKARLGTWAAYLLALSALVWVFKDVEWSSLVEQIQQISWPWVCAILVFDILSFYVQGVRWRYLLNPCGQITPKKTTQAIYVGLFSSEVLPLRAGEIIRGVLVSRWMGKNFRDVLPSMAVERLLDGLWFSASMAVVALLVPIPGNIRTVTVGILAAAAVGMGLFAWNARRIVKPQSDSETQSLSKIKAMLQDVTRGLQSIGFSRDFWAATAFSGLLHVVQALAFISVVEACGIDLPLLPTIAVFLIVQIGIAIPNAPANVGTYQLFCVLGLTFFGVEKSSAAAVSVVAFAILTFPVLLIGALATLQAGLSLTGFRSQLKGMTESGIATETAS